MIILDQTHSKESEISEQSVEQLQSIVYRYCLSLTKSHHEAEDLAQDTWLKGLEMLKWLGHSNPEAYLLKIAKNKWIDQIRRNTRLTEIIKQERPKAVTSADEGPFEIEMAFQALLKHLSPIQRTVFLLREVFGYSIAESAEKLKTTEGAVKAALHRARHALKAVKDDLDNNKSPIPLDNHMQTHLERITSVYVSGDIATLLELVQLEVVVGEPTMAIGSCIQQTNTHTMPSLQYTNLQSNLYMAA